MTNYKLTLLSILSVTALLFSYQYGKQNSVSSSVIPDTVEFEQNKKLFNCPYVIEGGVYTEYVKLQNEVEVVGAPVLVDHTEVIKLSEPFNQKELEGELYSAGEGYDKSKSWNSRKIDVNSDGDEETIINADLVMNHTPNIALIVDEGKIIFQAGGANVWIDGGYDGNGFLLSETVDWNIGERKMTRYVFKDGGFLPVWTQKACWVKFE